MIRPRGTREFSLTTLDGHRPIIAQKFPESGELTSRSSAMV